MSDKKTALDILGESHLPADLLTPTLGSNYGMDGYPDMEYGMGVLEGVLDPELHPAPALPTGVQKGAADIMDLSVFLEDATALTDHSWLDPSQLQDPERLPKTPSSIPELEKSWTVSSDGLKVWNRDIDKARYEEGFDATEKKASASQIRSVVRQAMRRSAMGQDINVVVEEALTSMGEEMGRVAGLLKRVRAEHGLTGNVYLRASAYPGWSTGKWSKHARRYASKAKYLIVSGKDLQGSTWIQNGRCAYTGKLCVTEVPWDDAYAHFAPRLKAAGYRVASGDPKLALKAAFLSTPEKKQAFEVRPTHQTPDQRVSSKKAQEEFQAYTPERKVYDPAAKQAAKKKAKVEALLNKMAREGLIPEAERQQIWESTGTLEDKVRAAHLIANRVKKGQYSGAEGTLEGLRAMKAAQALRKQKEASEAAQRISQRDPEQELRAEKLEAANQKLKKLAEAGILPEDALQALTGSNLGPRERIRAAASIAAQVKSGTYAGPGKPWAKMGTVETSQVLHELAARAEELVAQNKRLADEASRREYGRTREAKNDRRIRGLVAKVEAEIQKGRTGQLLRDYISRTIPKEDAPQALKYLMPTLKKTGALNEGPYEAKEYEGAQYRRANTGVKGRVVLAQQVKKASTWLRRTMSEGFAGEDLKDLIHRRFSENLLREAADEFREIRAQHEGASGFLYVDAEAYASDSGVTGCESGALKHRANQIKSVQPMSRCGTCSLAQTLPDGTKKCGVYNKPLVDFSGDDLTGIKKANIDGANMNDVEATASLFAPKYNPAEFGLKNSNLEDLEVELPEHEKMAEITFGDWNIG